MMTELAFLASIHHSGSSRYVTPNTLHPGEQVQIRLRARLDALIQQVLIRICPDGEQRFIPMQPEKPDKTANCLWWGASMHASMPLTSYRLWRLPGVICGA